MDPLKSANHFSCSERLLLSSSAADGRCSTLKRRRDACVVIDWVGFGHGWAARRRRLATFGRRPPDMISQKTALLLLLEDTARYAGLLLAPAESFGLVLGLFLPFGPKKSLLCCFGPFLAFFGVQ